MTWGNPQTVKEHIQTGLLQPFASAYGLGNGLHKLSYDLGITQSFRLPVPVISIGNITCGGTGKTPMVIHLAQYLINLGFKVGILSRGYKRKTNSSMTIVGDGKGNLSSCLEAGDEPLLIAQSVPQAVVISSPNRITSGMKAINDFGCQILILDDGFQYYRLVRDLDLVLIDYVDEPMKDSLLPAGRLREPIINLARASVIAITKVPISFDPAKLMRLKSLIQKISPQAEVTSCRFMPKQLRTLPDGNLMPITFLSGKKVITFCGLARPDGFNNQVKELGAVIVGHHQFPDHHWYSNHDMEMLGRELKQQGAEFLVTTQKDLVKLETSPLKDKLLAIELETNWLDHFPQTIQSFIDQEIFSMPATQMNQEA